MKKLSLILMLAFPLALFAQNDTPPEPEVEEVWEENVVMQFAEQMPTWPTCTEGDREARKQCTEQAVMTYLMKNTRYPALAQEKGIGGTVFVQYTIDEKGVITNPKVLRGVHTLLDQEALRVVSSMPKHTPGMQQGKPVKVMMNIPIRFTIK